MTTIRWGVIGAGGIAARRTIPEGITRARNSKLVAVMDVRQDVAAQVAAANGAPKVYSCEEDILQDPEVDAVYIATPAYLHASQVAAAAKHGKHVLCEKPFVATADEARRLTKVCHDAGIRLGVGLMMRFHGAHQQIKELLERQAIGQVVSARAQLTCWYPRIEGAWRQRQDMAGGGALMDMGVHCVDLLRWFLGEVSQVCGLVDTLTHDYEVDDSATILLQFESGTHAVVEAFFNIPDAASGGVLELYGTKGCLLARGTVGQDAGGSLSGYVTSTDDLDYDPMQARAGEGIIQALRYPKVNAYQAEIEHFAHGVLSGASILTDGEEATRDLQVLEAAYRSACERRCISC